MKYYMLHISQFGEILLLKQLKPCFFALFIQPMYWSFTSAYCLYRCYIHNVIDIKYVYDSLYKAFHRKSSPCMTIYVINEW